MDRYYFGSETRKGNGFTLSASEAIGRGGAGSIYFDPTCSERAIKLYASEKAIAYEKKVFAMLASSPEKIEIMLNEERFNQLAWPLESVRDSNGNFRGFSMPLLAQSKYCELSLFLQKRDREFLNLVESYEYRFVLARNLASVFELLHDKNHCMIDVKPENIFAHKTNPMICLVDCDGFAINSAEQGIFPANQFTPGYIAPEAQQIPPEALGKSQDLFALAVIIFQLLNNGLHPYQGIPKSKKYLGLSGDLQTKINNGMYAYGLKVNPAYAPHPLSLHLFYEHETRCLFDRSLSPKSNNRVSASEWKDHFDILIQSKVFIKCKKNAEHFHFSKGCGLCSVATIKTKRIKTLYRRVNAVGTSINTLINKYAKPLYRKTNTVSTSINTLVNNANQITSQPRANKRITLLAAINTLRRNWQIGVLLTVSLVVSSIMGNNPSQNKQKAIDNNQPKAAQERVEGKFYTLKNSNIRQKPTIKSLIISGAKRGTPVYVVGKTSKNWYKIHLPNKSYGFIYAPLITHHSNCTNKREKRTDTIWEAKTLTRKFSGDEGTICSWGVNELKRKIKDRSVRVCKKNKNLYFTTSFKYHAYSSSHGSCQIKAHFECPSAIYENINIVTCERQEA